MNAVLFWVFAGIALLLTTSTLAVYVTQRTRPAENNRELNARIKTWWVIAVLLLGSLLAGTKSTLIFFAFLSFLALKEFYSVIPTRRADRRVLFYAYLSIPIQYYFADIGWYGMFVIFIPVYMFLFLPLRMVLTGETEGFLTAAGTLYWGLMMTVYSLSHLGFMLMMPYANGAIWKNSGAGGVTLVVFLVLATQLNDVFQYLWGKSIGGPKVVPKISPGKTWAGLIGGVGSTTVLSYFVAPLMTPLTKPQAMLAGVIIGLGGFFGDITESALKRDLHIKDSGSILPGHGGILDRVDSMTFTAPLFFHFIRYVCFK